jgi:ribosomal protein S18 acetylase RimI-like enzyme
MVRKATKKDIQGIIALLHQVNMVHHIIRPDLFKPNTTKYNEQELEAILSDDSKPIFVFEAESSRTDEGPSTSGVQEPVILGHAFCQVNEVKDHALLQDVKTLYIDDICVDEAARGKHVGKALYEYVRDYARSIGCYNITLNVWEGNDSALNFYRSMGMQVQKTGMETIL